MKIRLERFKDKRSVGVIERVIMPCPFLQTKLIQHEINEALQNDETVVLTAVQSGEEKKDSPPPLFPS